jgi:hypothetical protein
MYLRSNNARQQHESGHDGQQKVYHVISRRNVRRWRYC